MRPVLFGADNRPLNPPRALKVTLMYDGKSYNKMVDLENVETPQGLAKHWKSLGLGLAQILEAIGHFEKEQAESATSPAG